MVTESDWGSDRSTITVNHDNLLPLGEDSLGLTFVSGSDLYNSRWCLYRHQNAVEYSATSILLDIIKSERTLTTD